MRARIRSICTTAITIGAFAACSSLGGLGNILGGSGTQTVTGNYTLQTVNGNGLPYTFSQNGSSTTIQSDYYSLNTDQTYVRNHSGNRVERDPDLERHADGTGKLAAEQQRGHHLPADVQHPGGNRDLLRISWWRRDTWRHDYADDFRERSYLGLLAPVGQRLRLLWIPAPRENKMRCAQQRSRGGESRLR
jgi:hypothetical protein